MPGGPPLPPERDVPFEVMAMPSGPTCNIECEYCYYIDKTALYPGSSNFGMSDQTLETFVEQYIEAHPGPQVTFAWQGGEPTLRGLDFFRDVVRLQEAYSPSDKRIVNTLQTNGTLLDDEWGRFLSNNEFLVGISIDGPRDLHNQYRKTGADGPTFEEVMNGLSVLQKHDIEYNVLCVVSDQNSQHPQRVYDFFKSRGVEWLQFIPLIEMAEMEGTPPPSSDRESRTETIRPGGSPDRRKYEWVEERAELPDDYDEGYEDVLEAARESPVTDRSVDPLAYGDFMRTIFDDWVRNDVGTVSVRLFDHIVETALRGQSNSCIFLETCPDQVAIEHNGDIYSCDHFVDPGFRLGNIHERHLVEMLESDEQRRFTVYKREGLPTRCRECSVLEFCRGGCPKNRHLQTPDGEYGLNYLCGGYRDIFSYVQPYLPLFERVDDANKPFPLVTNVVRTLDERTNTS